jgi:hypothetical protein
MLRGTAAGSDGVELPTCALDAHGTITKARMSVVDCLRMKVLIKVCDSIKISSEPSRFEATPDSSRIDRHTWFLAIVFHSHFLGEKQSFGRGCRIRVTWPPPHASQLLSLSQKGGFPAARSF